MDRPVLTNFMSLSTLHLQPYERYLPTSFDESLSLVQKVNKVIKTLDKIGHNTNGIVDQWNEVMSWLINDGLNESATKALNQWIEDGTLQFMIDNTGYVVSGLQSNANYFNPLDKKWYQDSNFTTEAFDNTKILQDFINTHKHVIIPSGSYYTGSLEYQDGQFIEGSGIVSLHFKANAGVTKKFPSAVLTNKNQPNYHSPDDVTREYHEAMNKDIIISNIVFDGSNLATWALQAICVDNLTVRDCTFINADGALDLRANTNSLYENCKAYNIAGDSFSVTDQNFKPSINGKRGITTNITFDNCLVFGGGEENDGTGTGKSAFEMDDGMSFVTFKNCVAKDTYGTGFHIHIHTSEYDMHHITFDNCKAINVTPANANEQTVCGFIIGQCPVGSYLGDIQFLNCESSGNFVSAFRRDPGAQLGVVKNITIDGGTWETTYDGSLTRNTLFACLWIGKNFDNFKIINATIKGCKDAYGIYTYDIGGDITIQNCQFKDSYIPLDINHEGGRTNLSNNNIDCSPFTTLIGNSCVYIDGDKATLNNNNINVDANQYNGSIIRVQNLHLAKLSGNHIINTGVQGNNAIYIEGNDLTNIVNNIVENFNNLLFISGSNASILLSLNQYPNCSTLVNSPGASGLLSVNNVA